MQTPPPHPHSLPPDRFAIQPMGPQRMQRVQRHQRHALQRWLCIALLGSSLALGLIARAAEPPAAIASATPQSSQPREPEPEPSTALASESPPRYWQDQRDGWFWYRDPPVPPQQNKLKPTSQQTKQAQVLQDFKAMQRRLEDLKHIAVMEPSDEHLLAYMRYQRMVMDKSQTFAERWQRLLWQSPDLDYSLQGRPTNAMAIQVFDEQQRSQDTRTVEQLARQHALLFLFRGDCPFCHRFAPILKRFGQAHGMTILAVSLDGGALPEFPDARADNGIAARLGARSVPALFLSQPMRREIHPVGYGLMSDAELLQRVAAVGRDVLGMSTGQPADPFSPDRPTPVSLVP